jgi:hypothetical protein
MIAKFADHLPLYRQESIFGRTSLAIPRSTLAQWVGMTGLQLSLWSMRYATKCLGSMSSTPMKRRYRGLGSNVTKNRRKPYHLRSEPSSLASASIKQLRISAYC